MKTVLIVDDEQVVRRLLAGILRKAGYRVLEAQHGADALLVSEYHAEEAIDLLITDMNMPPFMNGVELAAALRQSRPGLKVLYISGQVPGAWSGSESWTASLEVDANTRFMPKPLSPADILAQVEGLLTPPLQSPEVREELGLDPALFDFDFQGERPTILLLAEDWALRRCAAAVLEDRDYGILESRNIGEALHFAEWHEGPIDLLLAEKSVVDRLDREWLERLGQGRPGLKILLIRGYGEDLFNFDEEDATPMLNWPFTPENLDEKVRQILDPPPGN